MRDCLQCQSYDTFITLRLTESNTCLLKQTDKIKSLTKEICVPVIA